MLLKKICLIVLSILVIHISASSIVLAEDKYQILNIAMTMTGWVLLLVTLLITYVLVWPLFFLFWRFIKISAPWSIRAAIIGSIFISLIFYHFYFYPEYIYIGNNKIIWNTVPAHVIGIEFIILVAIVIFCFATSFRKSRRA